MKVGEMFIVGFVMAASGILLKWAVREFVPNNASTANLHAAAS